MSPIIQDFHKKISDRIYLEILEDRVKGLPEDDQKIMRLNYHNLVKQFIRIGGKIDLGDEIEHKVIEKEIREYHSRAFESADYYISLAKRNEYLKQPF